MVGGLTYQQLFRQICLILLESSNVRRDQRRHLFQGFLTWIDLCKIVYLHFLVGESQSFSVFFFLFWVGFKSPSVLTISFYRWGLRSQEKTCDRPKAHPVSLVVKLELEAQSSNSYSCALSITPLLEISAVLKDFLCSAPAFQGSAWLPVLETELYWSLACLLCASWSLLQRGPSYFCWFGCSDPPGVYFWILLFCLPALVLRQNSVRQRDCEK